MGTRTLVVRAFTVALLTLTAAAGATVPEPGFTETVLVTGLVQPDRVSG